MTAEPVLRERAFGALSPDSAAPVARTPRERWLAGVAFGACGHYAAALATLEPLYHPRAAETDPVTASLAASTVASHRRQLGAHGAAQTLDGLAARLARSATEPDDDGARVDALLGLAADAIGLRAPHRTERLLTQAEASLDHQWRPRVRLGWVRTEWLLATGRYVDALRVAESTREYAELTCSPRHVTKSDMLLATCLLMQSTQRVHDRVVALATRVVEVSLQWGMMPLVWPTASLLRDVQVDHSARWSDVAERALTCVLARSDPTGRRLAAESAWMPQPLLRVGESCVTRRTSGILTD
jgi:hypothetical protein